MPDAAALLVLDMASARQRASGQALWPPLPQLAATIAALVVRARAAGTPVIYVDDLRGEFLAQSAPDDAGDEELDASLTAMRPTSGDQVLVRARPSAFDDSPLEHLLAARSVARVFLAGLVTEESILYTAIDASVRRLAVVIPVDGVASFEPQRATRAVKLMAGNLQAEIAPAGELSFSGARVVPGGPAAAPASPRTSAVAPLQVPTDPQAQRLIDALAVSITRSGLTAVKIVDIVAEARVSLRSFYATFANKDECFFALLGQLLDAFETQARAVLVFDRPVTDVMRRACEVLFEHVGVRPRIASAVLLEMAALSETGRQAREQAMNRFASLLCDSVADARRANPHEPIRPLTQVEALAAVGAIVELAIGFVERRDYERLDEMVEAAVGVLSGLVLASDPAVDSPPESKETASEL